MIKGGGYFLVLATGSYVKCSVFSFIFLPTPSTCHKALCPRSEKGLWGFPGGSVVKNLPANAGDTGSIPGPGGSHTL